MAYQNITADAYTANVGAATVNAFIDEFPNLAFTYMTALRLMVGGGENKMPMDRQYGDVLKAQNGGDYLRLLYAKTDLSTAGRADTSDPFTQASEQLLGKALWPFRDHSARILIDAGELWRCQGQGDGAIKDYYKRMITIASESFFKALGKYLWGYGYVKSAYLGATTTSGRQGLQGFTFLCDGPTDDRLAVTTGTGNGNKDGTLLSTGVLRSLMTATVDRYYGGIDRDDSTAVRWRGNHYSDPGVAINYTNLEITLSSAEHGAARPKFALTSKAIRSRIKALAATNQRFLKGEGFNIGNDTLSIDGVPIYADEALELDSGTTGPFEATAAAGGIFFKDADVTGATTILELDDMARKAVFFCNPDKLWIRALAESANADGTPKLWPSQSSQQVIGEIGTITWSGAMGGEPWFHSLYSNSTS